MSYYAPAGNIYFTRKAALRTLREALEDGWQGCASDLEYEVFSPDNTEVPPYIENVYEARFALAEYGEEKARQTVRDYERAAYGPRYICSNSADDVANMLWYMVGEQATYELLDALRIGADLECDEAVVEELLEAIKKLEAQKEV